MEDIIVPIGVVGMLFVGLPWLVFHYITKWKQSGSLSIEDEKLMDELYETARRLDDRLATIERIIAADHPDYALSSQGRSDRPIPVDPERDRDREPARRIRH
jgi:phage shock protein B